MKRNIQKGVLQHQVSMKPFTSWHIGGEADTLYWPLNLKDLEQFLKTAPAQEAITFIGLGSNVLVSDTGIPGITIITQGVLKEMTIAAPNLIRAEAGLSCAQVARFAAKNDLVGGEFLAGIPGTVGGALFMNAGAFGGETWEKIVAVETINRQGEIKRRDATEFEFGYRYTKGLEKDEWFVAGYFALEPGDGKASLEKIKALLAKRSETQPTGEPSCGSTFRNPEGNYAARLIEACGLKDHQIGDMIVSSKHANFLINLNEAKAEDTLALVQHLQKTVHAQHGVELHPEFKWIGRPAKASK